MLVTLPNYEQIFGGKGTTNDDGKIGEETTAEADTNIEAEDKDDLSSFLRAYQYINFVTILYGFSFWVMLGAFAYTNHVQVSQNVTTNEKLRKKWNAKR